MVWQFSLILLIALAYCYSTFSGVKIKRKALAKYVSRPLEPRRTRRRSSSFSIGLNSFNWLDSLGFFQTDKQNQYRIEKHIFSDPDRQTLWLRVILTAQNTLTPYLLINPHLNNTGNGDVAFVTANSLNAREQEDIYLSVKSTLPFIQTAAGYVGSTDGYQDLKDNGVMDWTYDYTPQAGNVAMMAQLPSLKAGETVTFDLAIGFGRSYEAATAQAEASLGEGYDRLLAQYNGQGSAIGWEDYLASLRDLPSLTAYTGDKGRQLYASALALKTMEDKSYPGALIASFSIPWGDTVNADISATGYRAVWPRDFYQVATALLALGDRQTPLVAFEYLPQLQVKGTTPGNLGDGGWFLQKTQVDGTLEWYRVQLDQTAMPIMLGWKLWQAELLSDAQIGDWYDRMLKPAADFLAKGGQIHLRDNHFDLTPPLTQQERWEEQWGYSPSTTAAAIAGLVTAADIAQTAAQDSVAATLYLTQAHEYKRYIEQSLLTSGPLRGFCSQRGQYFLRISQNPHNEGQLDGRNGGQSLRETEVLDGGFLELVRYGILPANSPAILATVCELDRLNTSEDAQVKYDFVFPGDNQIYPGWRRYSYDGYGERIQDGSNYVGIASGQRGRVWPFLTGERGHYELSLAQAYGQGHLSDAQVAQLGSIYVRGLEYFANPGLMLPEQVWDGVGGNEKYHYLLGEGTNSATPLAWTHAEYIKLVRSLRDKKVWDSYEPVITRYQKR
jgi:glucoamylase